MSGDVIATLSVQDATYGYQKSSPVFQNVNLSLCAGDILTILGPNGAGKSTLLNCMINMFPLWSGEIKVTGKDIRSYPVEELALEIAYVPQIQSISHRFTVRDYVLMGRAPHIGQIRAPSGEDYSKADEALEQMNIQHLAEKSCTNLSGGERQQAQIARALVQEAKIILMDEPTNHLDYGNQLRILRRIAALAEAGITIVLTTHMPDHAILLDGYTGILYPGGEMKVGLTSEVVEADSLGALYGTDMHLVYIEELGRTACVAGNIRQNPKALNYHNFMYHSGK